MKDAKRIITLGILVAAVPFLGFPSSWKSVIFAVLGLAIAGLSYRILTRAQDGDAAREEQHESHTHRAVEHTEPIAAHE